MTSLRRYYRNIIRPKMVLALDISKITSYESPNSLIGAVDRRRGVV